MTRRTGWVFRTIEKVERAPIEDFDTGECLRFPRQAQFHILKYLSGLARAIEANGGKLYSNAHVTEWTGEDAPEVKIENGLTINAQQIVLATNYPMLSKMFAELPAYRTYVIGARVPKNSVEKCLIWDNADPYHLRSHAAGN